MGDKRTSYKEQVKMNRSQAAQARSRIQASKLVDRLTAHIMGEVELETSQVKAIEILINKTMPALTSAELQAVVESKNSATQETVEAISKFNEKVALLHQA